MKTIKLIVEVKGGCVYSIYGDKPPKGVEFEFIVRDQDNISAGDTDPIGEEYQPDLHYW